MILLGMALAPVITIIFYIIAKDKYNKEPFAHLFVSFLLGIASTIPAIIIQLTIKSRAEIYFTTASVAYYAVFAFVAVGFSEEFSKFFMLRFYAYRQKAFDEPLDGIIYGVMVSMGFASLENIMYVMQFGYGTAFARMFLSVPAHACFGVMMGYYTGLAKFEQARSRTLLRKGLFLAVFFHGCYDFFLFIQQNALVSRFVSGGLLSLGSVVSLYVAVRLSLRAIHLHQELSRIEFERQRRLSSL
jgi:RsiW-degrading membrane proteinase PrsW (M82 family)